MRKDFGSKPYLYPQLVMIIGTYDENGNPNAMNAAWGGMADYNKVMLHEIDTNRFVPNHLRETAQQMPW